MTLCEQIWNNKLQLQPEHDDSYIQIKQVYILHIYIYIIVYAYVYCIYIFTLRLYVDTRVAYREFN